MRHRLFPLVLAVALVGACSGDDQPAAELASTTLFAPDYTVPSAADTATTVPPTTTIAPRALRELPTEGTPGALITPTGIPVAVIGGEPGNWLVQTPCAQGAFLGTGEPIFGAHVVLDPGHGGEEPGAVGPGGTTEKDLNLLIAAEVASILEREGVTTLITRRGDYRITIKSRAALATALRADAFVSIHHNAEPDGQSDAPGTETWYQIDDPESRRLSGLIYEEMIRALAPYDVAWVGDTDAGVKYRLNQRGTDYYGILRDSAGVPAALVEALFLSNAAEEALLVTPEFRTVESEAIAAGIMRFLTSSDSGSGYVEPYERVEPAGPGGGADGCEDPLLE